MGPLNDQPQSAQVLGTDRQKSYQPSAVRLAPARRYPIVTAFLRHSMEEITDELVNIFDRCLANLIPSWNALAPLRG